MTEQAQAPVFAIQRMYLKDLSLEIPHAPQIFLETKQPTVEVGLDVTGQQVADGIYESTVTVTVTTKVGEKVAFLVEAKQGGIFEIRNVPDEQMDLLMWGEAEDVDLAEIAGRTGLTPQEVETAYQEIERRRVATEYLHAPPSIIDPSA